METPVKEKEEFRNYDQGEITAAVKEHYRKMRSRQTYDYVQRMKAKYLTFERPMDLWRWWNIEPINSNTCVHG